MVEPEYTRVQEVAISNLQDVKRPIVLKSTNNFNTEES